MGHRATWWLHSMFQHGAGWGGVQRDHTPTPTPTWHTYTYMARARTRRCRSTPTPTPTWHEHAHADVAARLHLHLYGTSTHTQMSQHAYTYTYMARARTRRCRSTPTPTPLWHEHAHADVAAQPVHRAVDADVTVDSVPLYWYAPFCVSPSCCRAMRARTTSSGYVVTTAVMPAKDPANRLVRRGRSCMVPLPTKDTRSTEHTGSQRTCQSRTRELKEHRDPPRGHADTCKCHANACGERPGQWGGGPVHVYVPGRRVLFFDGLFVFFEAQELHG